GDNGALTLALDGNYALPQGCAVNKIAQWNGTGWQCADDQNTSYNNGTGLDLNAGTFSIDSAYQLPQGCGSGQVPKSDGADAWNCQNDNGGLTGLHKVEGFVHFTAPGVYAKFVPCPEGERQTGGGVLASDANGVVTETVPAQPSGWVGAMSISSVS